MSAVLSPCGAYRYRLDRELAPKAPSAVVIMINPSAWAAGQCARIALPSKCWAGANVRRIITATMNVASRFASIRIISKWFTRR